MKTAQDHFNNAYIENGIIRWNSNDSVPPVDILTEIFVAGYISQETLYDSVACKKEEDNKFIEQYVENRKKYGYSAEELAEMQNAFGDEEVVDIFTGQKIAFN